MGTIADFEKRLKEASIELNLDRSGITKCCRNKLITVGGYK